MGPARDRRVRDREHRPRRAEEARARPPRDVDAVLELQRSAGNRAAVTLLQRYYYRPRSQNPVDEAIRYSDDAQFDPVTSKTAKNLRPDTELNYFKLPHKKNTFHYLNGQPADPLQHAYVKGLLGESRRVIEKGQELLELMERELPPETAPFMLGLLETEENILVTHSGAEPKPGFDAVTNALNEVQKQAKEKQLKYVRESPEKSPEYGGHRVTCAAPKLLATVDAAKLLPAMTEIWFDPGGQGVVVDDVRYHHGQRVPSCTSCEHNLRLMVFKQMRKQVLDAVRAWSPEVAPAASTDLTLERVWRVSKPFLNHFRVAADLVKPLGGLADIERTKPAAVAMAQLREKAERQVATPQSEASLRTVLRALVADAREEVKRHQRGVMEGAPDLTDWTAHGMLALKYETDTYPAIYEALKQAEQSL
jgi:soluble cytochrome b562